MESGYREREQEQEQPLKQSSSTGAWERKHFNFEGKILEKRKIKSELSVNSVNYRIQTKFWLWQAYFEL